MHAKPRCNGGAAPVGDTLTEGRGADGEFQLIRQNAEGLVDVNQIVVGQLRKHLVRFTNQLSSSSASSLCSPSNFCDVFVRLRRRHHFSQLLEVCHDL